MIAEIGKWYVKTESGVVFGAWDSHSQAFEATRHIRGDKGITHGGNISPHTSITSWQMLTRVNRTGQMNYKSKTLNVVRVPTVLIFIACRDDDGDLTGWCDQIAFDDGSSDEMLTLEGGITFSYGRANQARFGGLTFRYASRTEYAGNICNDMIRVRAGVAAQICNLALKLYCTPTVGYTELWDKINLGLPLFGRDFARFVMEARRG